MQRTEKPGPQATSFESGVVEQYRLLMKSVVEYAIVFLNTEGQVVGWNVGAERLLGYSEEEALGQSFAVLFTPEDRARDVPQQELREATTKGRVGDDRWHLRKDGTRFWASGIVTALRDAGSQGFVLITRDQTKEQREKEERLAVNVESSQHAVTAERQTEVALRESEGRYRFLFEKNLAGVLLSRGDGAILEANDAAVRIFGVGSQDELLGRRMLEFYFDPADRAALTGDVLRDHAVTAREIRFRHADGHPVWVLANISYLHDSPNGPVFHSTIFDITNRKRAEEELRLRERAMQAVSQGIIVVGPIASDNPIIYASPGFERLTGYTQQEVLGRNCRFLQGEATDPATVAQLREAIRAGRPCAVEILNYRKDGTPFWNALYISPIHDDDGQRTHFVGVQMDVTARRRLEEQFQQAQKMEAVGQLAAGIAHDFNNLLTVMNGYSELVLAKLSSDHPDREMLAEIPKAGQRAAVLTRQLLAFSRRQVLSPEVLDLNHVVVDLEKMLQMVVGEHIALTTTLQSGLGRVKVDPSQVEQVVLNLAVNARDAMPTGGKLTIETRNVELDDRYAEAHAEVRPGRYVLFAVSDTGQGMTQAVKAHIFEPFFTTKEKGKGTGLGLAMVYGTVKQSGGHVEVYSEPGMGTAFKIYLPRVEEGIRLSKSHQGLRLAPQGHETVLVVEDEDALRSLIRLILQKSGYGLLEAAHGGEALRVAEEHEGPIHLLLSDVVMPELGGQQLAEKLHALHPETKVLFLSGYTDDAVVRHGVLQEQVNFLQKPFSSAGLARKVREVLDGGA